MSEWEILKIEKTNNKEKVLNAVKGLLKSASFEKDIKHVFSCIEAYQAAIRKIDNSYSETVIPFPQTDRIADYNNRVELLEFDAVVSPEQLIEKLAEIYSSQKLRFNYFAWSSITAVFANQRDLDLTPYMLPVVDFVSSHPYLKTDVLKELYTSFNLSSFFQGEGWAEISEANPGYEFAAQILRGGHFDFDIYLASIDSNSYPLDAIDFLYARLRRSFYECAIGQYPQAYNLLAQISPELYPPVLAQRKLNVLHAAVKATNDPMVRDNIFPSELANALSIYPHDSHLLFLKADYIFSYAESENVAAQLVDILKVDPLNFKVFYFLGKQYLKENRIFEANIIFQKLASMEPLNIQFSAYAAKTSRFQIDRKLSNKGIQRDYDFYRDFIFELVDLNLYEEIALLQSNLAGDERYTAIFLYARHREAIRYSKDPKDYLQAALPLAKDDLVALKIKREILSAIKDWSSYGDFIRQSYEEFPGDDMVNYCMGEYKVFVEKDHSQAIPFFDKAIEVNPKFINAYFSRGRTAEFLNRHTEAVENMGIYVTSVTHYAPAYEILGDAFIGLKLFHKGFDCYVKAVSLRGVNEVSAALQQVLMYTLYHGYENCDEAEASYYRDILFKEGLELFDSLNKRDLYKNYTHGADAFYLAAKVCYAIDLYEKGMEYCNCALDIYRISEVTAVPVYIVDLKVDFLFVQEKYQDVVDFLLPLLKIVETDKSSSLIGKAYINLTVAYRAMRMQDEAISSCLNALEFYVGRENSSREWICAWVFEGFDWCVQENLLSQANYFANYFIELNVEPSLRHAYIYAFFARQYDNQGMFEQAIDSYQKCLEFVQIDPDYCSGPLEEATAYLNTMAREIKK